MKYAPDIINLMAAYPGRPFRISQIIRYVHPQPMCDRTRSAVREGVRYTLNALIELGVVRKKILTSNHCIHVYIWKMYQKGLTQSAEKVPE